MNLDSLKKLYIHELKDLYSVEKQICDSLPKMIDNATDASLKKALSNHLKETENQRKRIEKIMENHKFSPGGHKCKGIEGIIKEAEEVLDEVEGEEAKDAAIISMCQRVEHYEMAGYGTARAFAEQLSLYDEADELIKSLNEESAADHKLATLAWRKVNALAQDAMRN